MFNVVVFLMVAAHLRAVFSDPGTVPLPKTSLDFSDMHSGQKISKVCCVICAHCSCFTHVSLFTRLH